LPASSEPTNNETPVLKNSESVNAGIKNAMVDINRTIAIEEVAKNIDWTEAA
jgi:hypothetical protein